MALPSYAELMAAARDPDDVCTLAFAGVIAMAATRSAPYDVPIAGFAADELAELAAAYFPGVEPARLGCALASLQAEPARYDEFHDLVELLTSHCSVEPRLATWVARAIATASMGQNHLWQDMGLPHRRALSELIATNFAGLHARNVGDMKWKKFLYRQLCERAEILICKSPSCGVCVDHAVCFGPEEADARASETACLA